MDIHHPETIGEEIIEMSKNTKIVGCGYCKHHSAVGNNCKLHNICFSYGDHYELLMGGCNDFEPKKGSITTPRQATCPASLLTAGKSP